MKKLPFILLTLVLLSGMATSQERVSIAAAANLSPVAPSLSAAFAKKYPAYAAEFTFGASGALVTQILNGAPFHIFLSADISLPQKIVEAGGAAGQVRIYAIGSLIFLTTKKLDLSKGLALLEDPSVLQFANSNPETAPYGRAAQEALIRVGLMDKVRGKLVMAQNVTQALQYTMTGADAGFVSRSALSSKEVQPYDREGVYWFAVDPSLYSPIEQGFVVIKGAAGLPAVEAFASFLSTPEARAIFASFGYGLP